MKRNSNLLRQFFFIFLISFVPIFLVWLPFILRLKHLFFLPLKPDGFLNIIRNWDGPHYLIVAKTWYDPTKISKLVFVKSADYYPAHFPLFPFFIYLFHFLVGWLKAGIIANLFFGVLLNLFFYFWIKRYTKHPLLLTTIFTIFPARFLVVRAISAPETLMLFLMLLSFYFFERRDYFLASVFGSLAVLTKIQSLFLFFAYLAVFVEKWLREGKSFRWKFEYLWVLLIPIALLFLFLFYQFKTGNFWAFFVAERGNSLFIKFPFSQFNWKASWGGAWLEDVVLYIMGMILLTVSLYKSKHREWFYFSLFYTLFLIITPQRDITRFSYPLLPLFFVQFRNFLSSNLFKLALLLSFPAIYFYTVNFMLVNQAPVMNWALFIK